MKYALITAVAALGFASAAVAETGYANDTIMTRNVPATSILTERDSGQADHGVVSVTVGHAMDVQASSLLNPGEAAIASNGTVTSYAFGGVLDTNEGSYSYR